MSVGNMSYAHKKYKRGATWGFKNVSTPSTALGKIRLNQDIFLFWGHICIQL